MSCLTVLVFKMSLLLIPLQTPSAEKLRHPLDLTWPFRSDIGSHKENQPFLFLKKVIKSGKHGSWYASNDFCVGEHTGTHMDAPYHYYRYGLKVHEIPPKNLFVTGIKIDLTKETKQFGKNTSLFPEHLERWEARYGMIPMSCVILVQFGWAQYYENKTSYYGRDPIKGTFDFPGVSKYAAEWIINNRKIVGIGTDTAGLDAGKSTSFGAQKLFSQNNVYILQNLNIPINFPNTGFMLHVMPMNILGGTGAPLRLLATHNPKFYNLKVGAITWYEQTLAVVGPILYIIQILRNVYGL